MNLNKEFIEYCKEGNIEKVKLLLNNPKVDPYKGLENPKKECRLLIERFIKEKKCIKNLNNPSSI